MVGGEDCHNRLSAFTQNNVLQHIYSVGKTFTVLALSEIGEDPCGLMSAKSASSAAAPDAALRPKEISGSGVALFYIFPYYLLLAPVSILFLTPITTKWFSNRLMYLL